MENHTTGSHSTSFSQKNTNLDGGGTSIRTGVCLETATGASGSAVSTDSTGASTGVSGTSTGPFTSGVVRSSTCHAGSSPVASGSSARATTAVIHTA